MAALLSNALLRTQTDRRLAALAGEGSERAFEVIVERYRRPLQAYCRRLLLPADGAEDVVQQALLSTWQSLQRGTEIAELRPWLYRVTHNTALNALRKTGYGQEELSEALRGDDAPEEDLERRIAVRRTLAGLASLPELQREALLRTAVEGRSHEEVARALGLTEGAVRGLVYRARATVRAAATALTPWPLVAWAASGATRATPMSERLGELVAGGGSAGVAALLTKGGAAVLTAGALAGGAVVVEDGAGDRPAAARERSSAATEGTAAAAPASGRQPTAATLGDASQGGRRTRGGDDGRDGADRSGSSDSSGPGSGGDDDRSGPGDGELSLVSDSSGSGSSGSGSGGSSGSGSSGSDSSGSGSSGSDSSGSGSGSADSSGSGSSGSGSGELDSSGSGSSGSDSSGSGSGELDPSGSGISGSGISGSGGSGDSLDDDPSGSSGSG